MRGKVLDRLFNLRPHGITPAYAGKSIRAQNPAKKWRDHPRLCGEKLHIAQHFPPPFGSPPPMRGKAGLCLVHHFTWRITPAYAGKSLSESAVRKPIWDHPRLCGEKTSLECTYTGLVGSPPPMRGKEYLLTGHNPNHRITPAYAGKRIPRQRSANTAEDHPRLCGEKFTHQFTSTKIVGSPPPMRGKAVRYPRIDHIVRITPAYAGKSPRNRSPQWLCRDHPRLCGEKAIFSCSVNPNVGSPPPMRGKVNNIILHGRFK